MHLHRYGQKIRTTIKLTTASILRLSIKPEGRDTQMCVTVLVSGTLLSIFSKTSHSIYLNIKKLFDVDLRKPEERSLQLQSIFCQKNFFQTFYETVLGLSMRMRNISHRQL